MTESNAKEPAAVEGGGLLHIYTGDGKGKTTAALGLAIRAISRDLKVGIIFFDKGGEFYGERKILSFF